MTFFVLAEASSDKAGPIFRPIAKAATAAEAEIIATEAVEDGDWKRVFVMERSSVVVARTVALRVYGDADTD